MTHDIAFQDYMHAVDAHLALLLGMPAGFPVSDGLPDFDFRKCFADNIPARRVAIMVAKHASEY
jgi:hypothetical protein